MHNLSCHADSPSSWLSDLEQQNLVLCECLQVLLALDGRHLRGRRRVSVLLSWREGVETTPLPLSTPAPPAPLRFITTTRARSTSRGSTGNNGKALEMPALVTLLLRLQEGKDGMGAGTRTFVRRASKLRMASYSPLDYTLPICDRVGVGRASASTSRCGIGLRVSLVPQRRWLDRSIAPARAAR
jgi:hypothetical protein